MIIHSDNYEVCEILTDAFEKVPRATLIAKNSRIALDYHAELCNLRLRDNLKISIYISEKPPKDRNIYLVRGIVYKIEENRFEASFGGMLMFYEGALDSSLANDCEIYVSISKI